jgi:predicted phosphoribosyltransferase
MKFKDRKDAGKQLGKALEEYKNQKVIVLAIPRGGVEVGVEVSKYLKAKLSILIVRKLPFPTNPESGFGAVAEDGSEYLHQTAAYMLRPELIEAIKKQQKKEVKRRVKTLRKGKPLPNLEAKTVILVDDGIAMGGTITAAIMCCKNKKAAKIIVAVPVTSSKVKKKIGKLVDEIIVLSTPKFFYAVAQAFEEWHDATDEEVIKLLKKSSQ